MISKIEIENFKAFKSLDIAPVSLNVLAGMNGMGKSSLIQVLLLLRQSINYLHQGQILLKGDLINIGKGIDAFYQYSTESKIRFFIKNTNDMERTWESPYIPDSNILLGKYNNVEPIELRELSSLFTDNFQYLHANRIGPLETYYTSSLHVNQQRQLGNHGEYTVHYLTVYGNEKVLEKPLLHSKSKSSTLIHQTEAWLSEISPETKINTTPIPGTEIVLMDVQFGTRSDFTNRFRMVNVGFGISYVLPVIVSLLSAKPGRLIIIENPEAHLHPRGQAEMGRLIACAAEAGAQIFIETHSDHIINGIRVAVKQQLLKHNEVKLFYFDRKNEPHEQYSTVTPIKIDYKGELSNYPKNFMDEWNNQLFQLLRS